MISWEKINKMSGEDYQIGLYAHYKPLAALVDDTNAYSVLEIGTAYGGCAGYIMRHTKIKEFYSVDPYEYYGDELGCQMPGLECQEDYDKLYMLATFRLSHMSFATNLDPSRFHQIKLPSKKAIEYFIAMHLAVGLVFIDGAHTHDNILFECEQYSKLISPGGILCGHDWDIFEDVNKAVTEFATKNNFTINTTGIGNIWWIRI